MNTTRLLAAGALAFTLGSVVTACGTYDGEPELVRTHAMLVLDPDDPEELVEFSDEVFVGRVVTEKRTDYGEEDIPSTVYSVQVIDPIKGSPGGTTEVGLDGGVSKDGKYLYLMEGASLLTAGQEYVFAGRRDANGVLDLVSRNGSEPVDPGTMHAEEVVDALTAATASAQTDTPDSEELRTEPTD